MGEMVLHRHHLILKRSVRQQNLIDKITLEFNFGVFLRSTALNLLAKQEEWLSLKFDSVDDFDGIRSAAERQSFSTLLQCLSLSEKARVDRSTWARNDQIAKDRTQVADGRTCWPASDSSSQSSELTMRATAQ